MAWMRAKPETRIQALVRGHQALHPSTAIREYKGRVDLNAHGEKGLQLTRPVFNPAETLNPPPPPPPLFLICLDSSN